MHDATVIVEYVESIAEVALTPRLERASSAVVECVGIIGQVHETGDYPTTRIGDQRACTNGVDSKEGASGDTASIDDGRGCRAKRQSVLGNNANVAAPYIAAVYDGNVAVHRVALTYRRGLHVSGAARIALGDVSEGDRSEDADVAGPHYAGVVNINIAVYRVELIYRRGLRVADGAAVALGDVGNSDRSKNTGSGGAVVNVNQIWDRVTLRDVGGWGAVDNSRIGLNEV